MPQAEIVDGRKVDEMMIASRLPSHKNKVSKPRKRTVSARETGFRIDLPIFALQWKIKSTAHQPEGEYMVSIRPSIHPSSFVLMLQETLGV
jgi:hypothetical protein